MLSGAQLHAPQLGLIERACARGPPVPCASRSSGPPSSYGRRGPPTRDEQEPRRREWGGDRDRERERDWGRDDDRGARRPFSEQQQQQLLQRQREGPPHGQRDWGSEEAAGSWRDGPRGYNERGSAGGGRGGAGGGKGKREEAARKAARVADKAAEAARRSQVRAAVCHAPDAYVLLRAECFICTEGWGGVRCSGIAWRRHRRRHAADSCCCCYAHRVAGG